ncbi:retrovirus-related pol polyprotein from transposon TNT 1-94 [Tanacetum coccineum]|uniref:Retrovirus-related pol polyprotein from transposon TNT 1-94 n=1 Tax=Tanacetum coccineum TaxID=301880 RepID=A0ABQ4Y5Z0_9ASTR
MLRNVSAMSVNALYKPWRVVLSMINMCLTGKTSGYDRPRHPVLQILWGITHRSNIDYAERIWEEFVQSIQTFLTDRKNLATASCGKKKTALLLIPNVRFTKLIIHHLRTKHNIHPRTEHGKAGEGGATESSEATKVMKAKAAKVTKLAGDKAPKPTATQPPKPKPAPTQPSKAVSEKKLTKKRKPKSPLKLVDEPSDEGVPVEEPTYNEEDKNLQRALELSLMEQGAQTQGPAHPVVIREPESGRIQPLPEVQGKGKEKVVEEQAAHDLLTLQTPQKKSLADQFIFQKRPPMPTESSVHAELPSMDAELNLTDSETESDEETSKINVGNQEGQAGPNLGEQDEGRVGPNPGTSDASTQQKPKQMDEEFTTNAYPNVQENLKLPTEDQFFMEKPHEEESGKTNAEIEVQSMVLVPIHQDISSVPSMTTLVIDLTTMQSDSPLPTSTSTTLIITTTTAIPTTPQP